VQDANPESASREHLALILAAAVVQGWALFGLHHALAEQLWPSNEPGWLFALYAVAVLVPVTVELLAARLRERATWILVAVLAVAFFYLGWHHGAAVVALPGKDLAWAGESFQLGFVLLVLWILVMPFIQARLEVRAWTASYHYLFAYAWRNAVSLFEAAVFTAVFWLLLELWQLLFTMLGMGFFRELFAEPVFVYPVTALVFGCALHLIGSIDRFFSAVLEQILNVFKWLGTLTGALLALFTLALILQLPDLVFTGHKAISAVWLLWLAAVVVLFLNAAYRDGAQGRPYPAWIAFALRLVVPLSVVIALTALYALRVRAQRYGLTVERVFGLIVAAAALCYSLGYSLAALNRRAWFGGVARVNVLVALGLMLVLALVLTPVLSPYRLAASSQYRRILAGKLEEEPHSLQGESAFHYLRFEAGAYGRGRLEELARLQNHADAARIRERAAAALKQTSPWQPAPARSPADLVSRLQLFPQGSSLQTGLAERLRFDLDTTGTNNYCVVADGTQLTGLLVDLTGDGVDEFVLFNFCAARVYQRLEGGWQLVAHANDRTAHVDAAVIESHLARGEVSTREPAWKDLWIGQEQFQVEKIYGPLAEASRSAPRR
jgi:hypothetical protein